MTVPCLIKLFNLHLTQLKLVVRRREDEPVLSDVVRNEQNPQELPQNLDDVDEKDLFKVVDVVLVGVLSEDRIVERPVSYAIENLLDHGH